MDNEDTLQLILDAALTGQCALVVSQLLLSGFKQTWRLPLLLVFVAALWAGLASLFLDLAIPIFFALSGIAATFMAIAALWVYTAMITSANQVSSIRPYLKHFWPVPLALLALIPAMFLSTEDATNLLSTGDVDSQAKFRAVTPWIFTQFIWLIWTPPYLIAIWKRLARYRIALRDIHSSTERRELIWVSALVGVLFLFWFSNLLDFADLFGSNVALPALADFAIEALVIWIPALWGLRQNPGLHDKLLLKPNVDANPVEHESAQRKYQHSALDEQDTRRILDKVETRMQEYRLYRKPDLSLGFLSSETGISRHYLSQAINDGAGVSFFEYINRMRTRDAADMLKTTALPVIDISAEVGFNSRSSFYKAFKSHYGTSPTAYRKSSATN